SRHSFPPSCYSILVTHLSSAATPSLSLHDALPISAAGGFPRSRGDHGGDGTGLPDPAPSAAAASPEAPARHHHARRGGPGRDRRSEEHTSELQSRFDLVCRLLLEKKKTLLNDDHMR